MDMNSIITLQVGGFSNLVGAHWWNLQDAALKKCDTIEFDYKTMFFKGRSHKYHSYIEFPRLLAVDHVVSTVVESHSLSGAECYRPSVDDLTSKQGQFSEKCAWQDTLETELHPNSCAFLSTLQWGQSPETFSSGLDLSLNEYCREMVEDKVRLLAEEADYLQGFHLLLDMDNRFGGLGCGILQNLKDDYGNKAIFSFPLLPLLGSEHMDLKSVKRSQANVAFTLSTLHSNASLIMPLSLDSGWVANRAVPKLTHYMDNLKADQEAEMIALALETVSSLWRNTKHICGMYDAMGSITCSGRKMLGTSCSFPFHGTLETLTFMPDVLAFEGDANCTTIYRGEDLHPDFKRKIAMYDANGFEEQFFKTPCFFPRIHSLSTSFSGPHICTKAALHDSSLIGTSIQRLHNDLSKKLNEGILNSMGIEDVEFKEHCSELLSISDMYS